MYHIYNRQNLTHVPMLINIIYLVLIWYSFTLWVFFFTRERTILNKERGWVRMKRKINSRLLGHPDLWKDTRYYYREEKYSFHWIMKCESLTNNSKLCLKSVTNKIAINDKLTSKGIILFSSLCVMCGLMFWADM